MAMDLIEAIDARHSVRQFTPRVIDVRDEGTLRREIEAVNEVSGLHIGLVTHDEKLFRGFLARRGGFEGAANCIIVAGPKDLDQLETRAGYYGERLVLMAQQLGLNTCWVGGTFNHGAVKRAAGLEPGDKLVCVIALGYGANQGAPHRTKNMKDACKVKGVDIATGASMSPGGATSPIKSVADLPAWFRNGIAAALKAPTALNQQSFLFTYDPDTDQASVQSLGGPFSKVDLGIVAYHFEVASGRDLGLFG